MMPMANDAQKKRTARLIVAEKFGNGEKKEDKGDDGKLSAAEDLISAVHSKDAKGVASALQAAFDLYGSKEEQGEED